MTSTLGFSAGLGQPALLVELAFKLPLSLSPDLATLDQWLHEQFEVPDAWLRVSAQAPVGCAPAPAVHALATRAVALYQTLALACRIPVFALGRLETIRPRGEKGDDWIVSVRLPFVDELPLAIAKSLLGAALQAVAVMSSRPRTVPTIEQLYEQLDAAVVKPLRSRVPGAESTIPVTQIAFRLGIPFRHLGTGVYQLGWGARAQWLDRSCCFQDSAIGARLSTDKFLTAQALARAGLPAPAHFLVRNHQEAKAAAAHLKWPVVVKPANLDRGEGVSIDIGDEAQLVAAFDKAWARRQRVLVEQQVSGICHRIFVAGGTVIFAIKRLPKSVIGDGIGTVAELAAAADDADAKLAPWRRSKPHPLDALALATLAIDGLSLGSIPAKGQRVRLRPIESTEWGGAAEDVTDTIHPDNAQAALSAAALLGLSVAGVDMICEDITQPWHVTGAIINEVNFAPFFVGNLNSPRLPPYFARLIEGDGRIPVSVVMGRGDLFGAARQMQARLRDRGLNGYITAAARTENHKSELVPLRCAGLFDRCIALTLNRQVEAIVIVVDTDEFLQTGLPVDRLESVCVLTADADDVDGVSEALPTQAALLRLFLGYTASDNVMFC